MQTPGETSELWARYDVHAHVAIGRGAFQASRVVTLAPAFLLVNSADVPIQVCQHRSNVVITLGVGQSRPWPWFASEGRTELLARPASSAPVWCWSGRFSIAEVGNYNMRLTAAGRPSQYTIFPIGITMQVLLDCASLFTIRSCVQALATRVFRALNCAACGLSQTCPLLLSSPHGTRVLYMAEPAQVDWVGDSRSAA